jgi:DNA polymerase (family 10)
VAQTPPGLVEMLRIPNFGPKRIRQVYEELHIDSVPELRAAATDGRLESLKGFGKKLVLKILEGIEFLAQAGERVLYPEARQWAERLFNALAGHPGVVRIEVCGSLRRRAATIKDVDLLVASENGAPILERFVQHPDVIRVTGHGDTKASVVLANGMNADLRVVTPKQFAFALHYFTGSKAHNVRVRALAQDRGLKLNEYELSGPKKSVACQEESDIFEALGLEYIPPELREDTGEIEAAQTGKLPSLLPFDSIQGTFHCHTTYSDGTATLAEMAAAAEKLGYKYLGIADHSQTAAYAGGLSPAKVKKQLAEIKKLNHGFTHFRLFAGIESDILPDGSLDYEDHVLDEFDYVVASVHSQFNLSAEEMTSRIIRAIEHPACTMLGHPTGRLLLRRVGYQVDLDRVLEAAARHGVWVEINANPNRLDLDWTACKRAKSLGVGIVINPDAHSTAGLADVEFGVNVARRGWLEIKDVLNVLPAAEVAQRLAERKAKRKS